MFVCVSDHVLLSCVKHVHVFSSAADRSSKQLCSQPSLPGENDAIKVNNTDGYQGSQITFQ